MPETTSNVELAHRIHEHGHSSGGHGHRSEHLMLSAAVNSIASFPRA